MNPWIALPFLLGSLVVFQPLLNRVILEQRGLPFAAWLNSVVLISLATSALLFCYLAGDRMPPYLRPRLTGEWHSWFLLPGLMGFTLVFCVPLAIRSFGAFPTIVAVLCGQVLTSFAYDLWSSGRPITSWRVLGLGCVLVGAYLSFRPSD